MTKISNEVHAIQIKISTFIAIVGFLVALSNFIFMVYSGFSIRESLLGKEVFLLVIFSLFFLILRRKTSILVLYLQVLIIYLNGIIAILDNHEAYNGYGLIIIAVLMMYKYGMLKNHVRTKIISITVSMIFFIEYSFYLKSNYSFGLSFNYILYFIFFFTIIYILYNSEINRILKIEKSFKSAINSKEKELELLINDIVEYKEMIKEKEHNISKLYSEIEILTEPWQPIDLQKYKISEREESIIKVLCENTDLSNKEIAGHLEIKEGTVKQNLNKVYRKFGISSRQKLIELCQSNYKNPIYKITQDVD
ncbi:MULTISPECIES: helix-turn-helix transcriptional regulator [unclassified Oceanispirochaeta]|uniref:helix-turn-helix transcriptional regulator n=1 Tax=unclassified Oceanispirochaeta TaxID=2635722 RepID=UPI000E0928C6|nr:MULTISPECIES: helix-turn-helix transcriptional regulator [unclassified Oceanispirochaeta]MBF9017802.1 helix-turn-helix transcriptional regulator [Oceanispirochaeta sp. M2]NPD74262.1 helix-turn-helix transcriptional regulator [Oceanispirochaeta sp. M1]RDG29852.1 LuxR family transcriptional regulator [Oceanispirochaeta sp. M1]